MSVCSRGCVWNGSGEDEWMEIQIRKVRIVDSFLSTAYEEIVFPSLWASSPSFHPPLLLQSPNCLAFLPTRMMEQIQ